MSRFVMWHICKIIQTEMGLSEGQVMIYNQKKNLPPTSGLWVTVGFLTGKPFGSSTKVVDDVETQIVNMGSVMSIDLMSRDESALDRKEDIVAALGSTFAQQMQEKFSFKIGRLPSNFVDVSEVEGAAILFRYNMSFQVQYVLKKTKKVGFYDTFNHTVLVEP